MKICRKCNTEKPIDQFNRHKTRKDGLQAYCRDCTSLFTRKWRADNPDYGREYHRKNHAKNAEQMREYSRKWRADNTDHVREYDRARRAANPEKFAARKTVGNAIKAGKLTRPIIAANVASSASPMAITTAMNQNIGLM